MTLLPRLETSLRVVRTAEEVVKLTFVTACACMTIVLSPLLSDRVRRDDVEGGVCVVDRRVYNHLQRAKSAKKNAPMRPASFPQSEGTT